MKVNCNINFATLKGLILRANTDERLVIADNWLRGNDAITIDQYHELRGIWDKMVERYGTHKIVITCGSVKRDYMSGLTYAQALRACKASHWTCNPNNGCMWDMEIEWAG